MKPVYQTKKNLITDKRDLEYSRRVSWLVVFYSISTLVGYLTPSPVLNICDL